jgi:hypothetical protein
MDARQTVIDTATHLWVRGHPDLIALVSTYLFGREPVHLNSLYWREGDITQGVRPDIPVPQEQALEVAYRMALESIVENLAETTSRPLKLLREEARTTLDNKAFLQRDAL